MVRRRASNRRPRRPRNERRPRRPRRPRLTAPPFASPGCPAELRVLSTGELMHRIAEEHAVYTEDEVKKHLLVMLDTMKYMHNQGAPLQCRP